MTAKSLLILHYFGETQKLFYTSFGENGRQKLKTNTPRKKRVRVSHESKSVLMTERVATVQRLKAAQSNEHRPKWMTAGSKWWTYERREVVSCEMIERATTTTHWGLTSFFLLFWVQKRSMLDDNKQVRWMKSHNATTWKQSQVGRSWIKCLFFNCSHWLYIRNMASMKN